jgi:hypothetical protein
MGRPSLGRTTDEQKAANREYVHKYQRTHREQIIKYRADNPDKQREYQRRYREPTRIRYESCTVNIGTGYLREMIFMIDFWRDRMGLVRFVGLL